MTGAWQVNLFHDETEVKAALERVLVWVTRIGDQELVSLVKASRQANLKIK